MKALRWGVVVAVAMVVMGVQPAHAVASGSFDGTGQFWPGFSIAPTAEYFEISGTFTFAQAGAPGTANCYIAGGSSTSGVTGPVDGQCGGSGLAVSCTGTYAISHANLDITGSCGAEQWSASFAMVPLDAPPQPAYIHFAIKGPMTV